ncbi:MAG: hypothetical protein VKP62_09750 [Candidatus Sericytochromatia bacterium]|nr:hypothetical protein [Candidatus Sericytochromatia bacterium]
MHSDSPPSEANAEFILWPYLDTLYQWSVSQAWYEREIAAAWPVFMAGIPDAPVHLPELQDPDQHDRVLRFLAWFHLDRRLPESVGLQRPIDLFLSACTEDLTGEGLAIYQGLAHTRFGAFKVLRQFRRTLAEDWVTGDRLVLRAGPLSDELQVGDLVIGRLYPFEGDFEGDPDLHIGHPMELAGEPAPADPPAAEGRFFAAMVPAKGAALDVLDALLMQVDSPITADDVFAMLREAPGLPELLDRLYGSPAYRIRYLHLRDRALLEELLQELWDTSGPLQDANLGEVEATALARTAREALRAIAEGNPSTLLPLCDPDGLVPLYLELFGPQALKRLTDVTNGLPERGVKARHQLLPKDGGIFTTLSWGTGTDKHAVGLIAYAKPDGRWLLSDISLPEGASPAMTVAFDKAAGLGFSAAPPGDAVEAHLRKAVLEVGYGVHDTIDLFRLWREFKAQAQPDLSQPAIWAAGLELADTRFRNEDLDVKVLAKSYRVMPRAIEQAADQIEQSLRAKDEAATKQATS